MNTDMKRLSAYLPDPIYAELETWAGEESRSLSNLVGFLLEKSVRERRQEKQSDQQAKDK